MDNTVTLQDIYNLFQRSQEEADRRFAEADRLFAESKAEADRLFAESKAEADRRAAEAEARLARAEAIAAQANQAVSALTSPWEQLVENLVAPGVVRLFQDQGITIHTTLQRVRASNLGRHLEIDILAVNEGVAVAIEVKSRLTQKHIRQLIQKMDDFKVLLPQYQHHRLYGAVAAIEIDGDVDIYAHNQGFFVIRQSGDNITLSNPTPFNPRTW